MSSSDEEYSSSSDDLPPLPATLSQQLVAARDKAWQAFQNARTRSQKRSTAWAYFQLGGSIRAQWPRAHAIFRVHGLSIDEWLDEPTFRPAGTPGLTWEQYQVRWQIPPAFEEFETEYALAQIPAVPDPAPSSANLAPDPAEHPNEAVPTDVLSVAAPSEWGGTEWDHYVSKETSAGVWTHEDDAAETYRRRRP